jgi:hypothetical protein
VLLKALDGLGVAVFLQIEIGLGQIVNWILVGVSDDYIDDDQVGLDVKGGGWVRCRRLRRGRRRGLRGCEKRSAERGSKEAAKKRRSHRLGPPDLGPR